MTIDSIKKIAVVGAGTMGQGIAQVCASAGYQVLLYDIQPTLIEKALTTIQQNLQTSVDKGKLRIDQKDKTLNLIKSVTDFHQLQVDLVIEAIAEKLEVKQKLFLDLEAINTTDCLFATNTSSISVTQIAGVLKNRNRFAGMHFFNPAPYMKLVEIVKGASTSDETIDLLRAFAEKTGKVSVLVRDSPGFIVNRVARHFYVESLKIMEESGADGFKDVDTLLKSCGFKMGPFELMDLIGVDINYSVTASLFNSFHQDSKFRPSLIQQQKIDAGHLGRKSGEGFYKY